MKTRTARGTDGPLAGAASAASIGDGWRRNSEGPVGLTDVTMPCSLRDSAAERRVRRSACRHASIVARRESEHADPSPGLSGRLDGALAPIGCATTSKAKPPQDRPPHLRSAIHRPGLQDFRFPSSVVQDAVVEALEDLKFTVTRRRQDGPATDVEAGRPIAAPSS